MPPSCLRITATPARSAWVQSELQIAAVALDGAPFYRAADDGALILLHQHGAAGDGFLRARAEIAQHDPIFIRQVQRGARRKIFKQAMSLTPGDRSSTMAANSSDRAPLEKRKQTPSSPET